MPIICPNCNQWIHNYNSCNNCGYDVREEKHYTIISRVGNWYRPYIIMEHEIRNIKIYKNGEILFEKRCGWLEHHFNTLTSTSTDVTSIFLDEVKRSTKLNLKRTDNFIIKESNNIGFEQKSYTLYIHEKNAHVKKLSEKKDSETETEILYHIPYEINIPHMRMIYKKDENNKLTNDIRFTIKEQKFSRTKKKPFGKKVDETYNQLKEHVNSISKFEVANLLKNFDIIPKKRGKK